MKVAVTIPCRNEEKYIEKCVASVLASELSAIDLQVIVCDGCSTDRSAEIVRQMERDDPRVKLLVNEKGTTPHALNLGIRYATDADIHVILGAHAEMASDYITRCVDHLQKDSSLGCVGGIIENINEDQTSEIIAKAMSSPFGVGGAHFRTGTKSGYVDTVAFGAYPKRIFEQVGYFDEDLVRNQDDEFNYRLTKHGYRILLDPAIRSRYYVRSSFRKLARQYLQYGFWKVYVNKKHGAVTNGRQLIPPLFVLFLVSAIAIPFVPYWWMIWSGIFGAYIIGAIAAALMRKASLAELPLMVYTFLLLHVEYGSGYLHGIIRFVILGKNPAKHHSRTSR